MQLLAGMLLMVSNSCSVVLLRSMLQPCGVDAPAATCVYKYSRSVSPVPPSTPARQLHAAVPHGAAAGTMVR
jgi:hypothetical protein